MVERPILFSGPMVRAILAGTKTQTRRLMRDQPCCDSGIRVERYNPGVVDRFGNLHPGPEIFGAYCGNGCDWGTVSPFGKAGDRLWVRETWYDDDGLREPDDHSTDLIEYRADHDCHSWETCCPCRDDNGRSTWRPSIHMPRWASRITLEVTGVRVERLQDITEEDARAEGFPLGWVPTRITVTGLDGKKTTSIGTSIDLTARGGFCHAWDAINGKRATWESNPWVWVVSFRRVT